jgi:hypothetical protein
LKNADFKKNVGFYEEKKAGQNRLSGRIDLAIFDVKIWKVKTK